MAFEKIDDRDLTILKTLSQNGRIKISDLARQLNLTATPCWDRVRRLEKMGLIKNYKADIALQKIVSHIKVFVVLELESHRAETFQHFERAIERYDEITACWAIGGGPDYLMQVVSRDIDQYQSFIDTLLELRIGIAHYATYVVTKSIKMNAVPPFDILLANSSK